MLGAEIFYIFINALSLMVIAFAIPCNNQRREKLSYTRPRAGWKNLSYELGLVLFLLIITLLLQWFGHDFLIFETPARYYFPMWKVLLITCCVHVIFFVLWWMSTIVEYVRVTRVLWLGYACIMLAMVYCFWWIKDNAENYDASDTNVPVEAAPFSFEAVQKAFAALGYRLPVHFPLGMTADINENVPLEIKHLHEVGAVERVKRPSLVHEEKIILYQPTSAYWYDYDPLYGFRFADVVLSRLDKWQYANPISTRLGPVDVISRYRSRMEWKKIYARRADEPRRYTAEWQIQNYRPWTNDEQVMSSFPEIQKVKAAEAVSEKKSIITQLNDRIYVSQLDPLPPLHFLRKEIAPDRAEYNHPELAAPLIHFQTQSGEFEPVRGRRIIAPTGRLEAYLSQRVNTYLHEVLIVNAINTYLATYAGVVPVDKNSSIGKLIIHNGNLFFPPSTVLQRPSRSFVASNATRGAQKAARIVDPDLPAIVETEDTTYVRYAFFTLDQIKSISRVYETETADHFGYCQVRFTCTAAWVAPWIYDKNIISSHPLLAERVNALSNHEIVWTIRINGLGWNTGVREYGTDYSVVHNLATGSGM